MPMPMPDNPLRPVNPPRRRGPAPIEDAELAFEAALLAADTSALDHLGQEATDRRLLVFLQRTRPTWAAKILDRPERITDALYAGPLGERLDGQPDPDPQAVSHP